MSYSCIVFLADECLPLNRSRYAADTALLQRRVFKERWLMDVELEVCRTREDMVTILFVYIPEHER